MLVHISRHLSRMSNNNKRCQLIIRCIFCNSGRMDLVYDDVRYMVYRWGFPYLIYSFNVLISWNRKLGLYRWCIYFHRVILQIFGFIIIILYLFTSCLITCVLFYQFSALIILYHAYYLFDITYYLSACSCMPVFTTLWLRFIDTRVIIPARHLALTTPLVGKFLTPLNPHV